MISEEALDAAKEHALSEFPKESCGIVIKVGDVEKYIACRNVASNPLNDFVLPGEDYADAEDQGEIIAIMHSHPRGPARLSDVDRMAMEQCGHNFGVIAVGGDPVKTANVGWGVPCGWRAPLVGREFHYGTQDCYTLIRDYYSRELEIALPEFDHGPVDWWDSKSPNYNPDFNPYTDNFRGAGFVDADEPYQKGDIILMQIKSEVPNHAGVLIDDQGTMLHHLQDRPSSREIYGGYWQDITQRVIRYKGLIRG